MEVMKIIFYFSLRNLLSFLFVILGIYFFEERNSLFTYYKNMVKLFFGFCFRFDLILKPF